MFLGARGGFSPPAGYLSLPRPVPTPYRVLVNPAHRTEPGVVLGQVSTHRAYARPQTVRVRL